MCCILSHYTSKNRANERIITLDCGWHNMIFYRYKRVVNNKHQEIEERHSDPFPQRRFCFHCPLFIKKLKKTLSIAKSLYYLHVFSHCTLFVHVFPSRTTQKSQRIGLTISIPHPQLLTTPYCDFFTYRSSEVNVFQPFPRMLDKIHFHEYKLQASSIDHNAL